MKILFISDYYPPYVKAGAEVSTSLLAGWLARHGHTVSVACSKFSDKPWEQDGVTAYPIITKPERAKNFTSGISRAISVAFQDVASLFRILKLIETFDPDIINAVTYSRLHPLIIGIRIFSKRPIVIDCRGYDLICPADLNPNYLGRKKDFDEEVQTHHGYRCIGYTSASDLSFFSIRPFALFESLTFNLYKSILRFLVNHSKNMMLVAVSKYIKEQLILNGFKEEKIIPIYNISQESKTSLDSTLPSAPIFAYAGRVEEGKGVWDLVAASEILKSESNGSFLVKIAGTGGEFDKLQEYIKEKKLDYIALLGHIPPAEVLDLYGGSTAVIGPSRSPEPFGRFILDAITVGKPIIGTRAGGITEAIEEGETGFLVKAHNPEQLATAMEKFIQNPHLSSTMREAIMKKQNLYAGDTIGAQRIALYVKLKETIRS